jgi:SnoaL-like domain
MKKIFYSVAIFFFLNSCKENQEKSKYNADEIFVKKYFQHFNAHQWEDMANMYADTADFKDPSLGKEIVKQTKQQTIKKYQELATIFPNIKDDVVTIYPTVENQIVVEFISTGTGLEGKQFSLPICTIFTIMENKITKDFTYYDNSK